MPEPNAAADQPTVSPSEGAAESSAEPYVPSFARDSEPAESEETPEPQTDEAGEGESGADEAGGDGSETEPQEAQGEETPEQDEFLSSLTAEEVAYYAKRYPTLYKAYQDPDQPADLRQAFVDRVNQDHAYAELRDGQDTDEEGEPTADQTGKGLTPADPTEVRKQYYAQIDDIVAKQIDPQAVNELGSNLLQAMGVDLKSADPEVQAIVKNAPQVGKVLAKGAIDLLATVLPGLLPSRLESAMPQITEMYYDNLRTRTWDQKRQTVVKLPDGTETRPYAKLPAFGSAQWNTAIDKVLAEMPELREMFDNLPPQQRFEKQYSIAMKLMTGQQVNPAMVAQAVNTGKKLARSTEVQRAAGKALGAGKTAGDSRPRSSSNDDIFGPGVQEYMRRGG